MRGFALCLALMLASGGAMADSVTAVLEPLHSVELRSTVNGRVTRIVELEGTTVSAGDVVAELDGSVQEARVELARVTAEADSGVERARHLLEQAEFRRDRIASAADKGAAQTWEVELAEQAVTVAGADLEVARDELARHAAELELEKATLEEFLVRAPFDATVLDVSVDPGEIVDTATVLVEIGALDKLLATVFVPADWASALPSGEALGATMETGEKLEARIRSVDPRVDPASRTVRILVEVDNVDRALRPGEILVVGDPR